MKTISLVLVLTLAAMGCATSTPHAVTAPRLFMPTGPNPMFAQDPTPEGAVGPGAVEPAPAVGPTAQAVGPEPVAEPMPPGWTPPPPEESKAGKIILALLLLPLAIPILALAAMANSHGGGYGGFSCKGKVYADGTKWRSSCY
jgi:hypothetical protein